MKQASHSVWLTDKKTTIEKLYSCIFKCTETSHSGKYNFQTSKGWPKHCFCNFSYDFRKVMLLKKLLWSHLLAAVIEREVPDSWICFSSEWANMRVGCHHEVKETFPVELRKAVRYLSMTHNQKLERTLYNEVEKFFDGGPEMESFGYPLCNCRS